MSRPLEPDHQGPSPKITVRVPREVAAELLRRSLARGTKPSEEARRVVLAGMQLGEIEEGAISR